MAGYRDAGLPDRWLKLARRRRFALWALLLGAVTASTWAIVRYVSPWPPRTLVMSTGVVDGAYQHFGLKYQEILRADGVTLELRTSSGSVENLRRLQDGSASVGFVQGGTDPSLIANRSSDSSSLRALATVAYEPVWIFTREIDLSGGLRPLAGKRIAVGVAGSGNYQVAGQLLAVYGVAYGDAPNSATLVKEGGMAAVDLLHRAEIDAAIIVAAPEAPAVQALLSDGHSRLASLDQVEGLVRRSSYLQSVGLKRGSINPATDSPPRDVNLLSTTANIVVREELHPALAYLLLEAARRVHRSSGLLNPAGMFPSPKSTDYPLSDAAERYFRDGRPFLQNYFPFWVANAVQRMVLLLVPLATILIPLTRALPELISWRRRSRLYRRYGELKFLELELKSRVLDAAEAAAAHARLDRIESDIVDTRFPLDFADRVYTLRQHLDYVRRQLARQS